MRSPWRFVGQTFLSVGFCFYNDTILITNVRLSKTRETRTELKLPHRSLESGLVRLVRGGTSALSKHSGYLVMPFQFFTDRRSVDPAR
jgi:hypothetical protein